MRSVHSTEGTSVTCISRPGARAPSGNALRAASAIARACQASAPILSSTRDTVSPRCVRTTRTSRPSMSSTGSSASITDFARSVVLGGSYAAGLDFSADGSASAAVEVSAVGPRTRRGSSLPACTRATNSATSSPVSS